MLLDSPSYTQTPALCTTSLEPLCPSRGWCVLGTSQASLVARTIKKTSKFRADTERGRTTKLQAFFQRAPFWLGVERKLTNYSCSGIWQAFFSKVNKISLSLQGKQLTVLLPMIKSELPKQKPEFWKISIHHSELDSLPELKKTFLIKWVLILTNVIFKKYCLIKCVNIWKICIIHWINIFQVTNTWRYKTTRR